jgi:prepilin-type N-terminal cleavage/methylation domain-containing protein
MENRYLFKKQKRGFTLIELLIVIAIIGILASVVLVSLSQARNKAQSAKALLQMRSISQGVYGCLMNRPNAISAAYSEAESSGMSIDATLEGVCGIANLTALQDGNINSPDPITPGVLFVESDDQAILNRNTFNMCVISDESTYAADISIGRILPNAPIWINFIPSDYSAEPYVNCVSIPSIDGYVQEHACSDVAPCSINL